MKVFPQEYVLELVVLIYLPEFNAKSDKHHPFRTKYQQSILK